ncbi:MAG: hypothetical protein AAF705_03710, partial [Bacteroidota bacterium]
VIYVSDALFEIKWMDPFYTNLAGVIGFTMAAVTAIVVWRGQRKDGGLPQKTRNWPPGSGRIFLIAVAFLLIVAVAFWGLFIRV